MFVRSILVWFLFMSWLHCLANNRTASPFYGTLEIVRTRNYRHTIEWCTVSNSKTQSAFKGMAQPPLDETDCQCKGVYFSTIRDYFEEILLDNLSGLAVSLFVHCGPNIIGGKLRSEDKGCTGVLHALHLIILSSKL